jgi:acetylornithine deacetylase
MAERDAASEWMVEQVLRLCRCDSTTGREDPMLGELTDLLGAEGAEVSTLEAAPGRTNVLATWGTPKVLFTTHLDTVAPYIPPVLEAGVIRGRGTCDAKGQIVAQLAAIRQLLAEDQEEIAWLGVVGEESDAIGAAAAARWARQLEQVALIVNGEPTGLVLAAGQRGYLHMRLRCRGHAAHSGSPELGRSAVWPLIDWLAGLRARPTPTDPDLGEEVWNLGVLAGGRAANIIPDEATAEILCRPLVDSDFEAWVRRSTPQGGALEILVDEKPARYAKLAGFDYAPMPFGSDLPALMSIFPDAAVALAGPGSIAVAHTAEEHIKIADLEAGATLNRRLALHVIKKQK